MQRMLRIASKNGILNFHAAVENVGAGREYVPCRPLHAYYRVTTDHTIVRYALAHAQLAHIRCDLSGLVNS